MAMTDSPQISGNRFKPDTTFILRFTWNASTGNWLIHLKQVEGGEARLFMYLEDLFFFLESHTSQK